MIQLRLVEWLRVKLLLKPGVGVRPVRFLLCSWRPNFFDTSVENARCDGLELPVNPIGEGDSAGKGA